jgi:hypothetical protein
MADRVAQAHGDFIPKAQARAARAVKKKPESEFSSGGAVPGYDVGGSPHDDGPVFDPTRLPPRPAATFSPPVFDPTRLQKPAGMSWSDVASAAIENTPESAKNFALDVVRPITHPIETVGARVSWSRCSRASADLRRPQRPLHLDEQTS